MARLITVRDLPPTFEFASSGDWHCGSKAFHESALDELIGWLLEKEHRYLGFNGDSIEGKRIDSPHFDPAALHQHNIESQLRFVRAKIAPVKDRILWWGYGNHDIYVQRDIDPIRTVLTDHLGLEHRRGDYQTWVDLGYFRVHVWHGRASLPRGAKDPIQRDANQRAWLVNRLAPLAGDCLMHFMGHTHALLVQKPIESYALLCQDEEVRARYFVEPAQRVVTRDHAGVEDVRHYIPPLARWYANTGTLRRSGGFGWTDYAEIAGYPPSPIGWVKTTVDRGHPVEMVIGGRVR